ncbi:casein kinase I [Gregarina niphandrodes]|uniref:Casein kinase I n=1 Tax=Gregarina niphandrodes TaxID=110365 RepID=A0A023BBA3_GRENI|nr:casein kinase I [Gregarina niphandrodes]EZG79099.1 casein kinase I [Gregarina niphandrodes]|eukprot:XP_011129131.1 casein kinase I [Gregarina niphandrodes]
MTDEAVLLSPHTSPLVANVWRVTQKIGSGSFGEVYIGLNVKDDRALPVAIKIESSRKRNPHLIYEAKLMQQLEGGVGVPVVHYYGQEHGFNVMVLDLLGPSLEELFDECNRKFSLKTALQLIEMMLCRIEFVHSRFIIHRDIKPHNFLMGRGKLDRLVHIIDFGLAKKYRDPKTLDHIPYKEGKTLTGTARYVSINTHVGIEQARRDDMESLAYVFIYFVQGQLPWQSLKASTKKEKYDKIKEMKICKDAQSLCVGLPKEFADYLSYTRLLRFTERPDYTYCRSLFRDLFFREQFPNDFLFDWSPINNAPSGRHRQKQTAHRRGAENYLTGRRTSADYYIVPPTAHRQVKIRKDEAIYNSDNEY